MNSSSTREVLSVLLLSSITSSSQLDSVCASTLEIAFQTT